MRALSIRSIRSSKRLESTNSDEPALGAVLFNAKCQARILPVPFGCTLLSFLFTQLDLVPQMEPEGGFVA